MTQLLVWLTLIEYRNVRREKCLQENVGCFGVGVSFAFWSQVGLLELSMHPESKE